MVKKSHNAEKKLKGDPSVSSSFVCYARKEQLLQSSSLGQKVQFGDLKTCRTFARTILVTSGVSKKKQAGTGPSRRHIQGSKIAKTLSRVNLQYSKIEKAKKMDRVVRRGPLARAPGALKGGHFRNCQHFCRS